ncbi:MAG: ATP-binding protein [Rhodocyclaceae bacterium]|nr:ATP-binding protein [Rhodocyclaceae bacterium]
MTTSRSTRNTAPEAAPAVELPAAALARLADAAERLVEGLAHLAPPPTPVIDWKAAVAFRWRRRNGHGQLLPVTHRHRIDLADLQGVDAQKKLVDQNTRQFVQGAPANNVLLTGARGTGKSSLVKAVLNRYAPKKLRLIEVDKQDLLDLPEIVDTISARPERFILYCDDLPFEADEPGYKALKTVLDGSISAASENVLVYATSNRRHLMPEYMNENLEYKHVGDEIHPGETSEEKISLSERFGLWVSFWPFTQDEYLAIVDHWLAHFGVHDIGSPQVREAALQWALGRSSRSGRIAWHFARDWAGRQQMGATARQKRQRG